MAATMTRRSAAANSVNMIPESRIIESHPTQRQAMYTHRSSQILYRLVRLTIVGVLLVSCAQLTPTRTPELTATLVASREAATQTPTDTATPTPTATRAPTPSPTPTINQIKEGIQKSLDLYALAYTNNDENLLGQAVDQAPPFWRFVTTRFEDFQKSFAGGQIKFSYTVQDVRRRDFGFVEARVMMTGGYEADWLFHEQDGKWLLAEPSAEQMGEPKITEREGFTFQTWGWADDTNSQVIDRMSNARQRVLKVLGKVPDQKATVHIKPVYAISPFDDPFAVAYYSAGYRGQDDNIEIFSPHSYGFGEYDLATGWQKELEDILTHEYTHMVHRRSFDNAGQVCAWMVEGLAEYVTGDEHQAEVRYAISTGKIIPIVDTREAYYKQDLNHLMLLRVDRGLAYGFSVALVTYVTQKYGGLDGFWKLARACDKNPSFGDAVQQSFGVTFDRFNTDWLAWLKKY